MRGFRFALSLFLLAGVTACMPYTSVPMVALMGYDSVGKRERLEKYAASGDVYAMYDLAQSYRKHMYEGKVDHEKALDWYCKAARGGYGKAQMEVAQVYEGTSELKVEVEQDLARAYMWYVLAERRKNFGSEDALKAIKEKISDKEKARGEMWLTEWKLVPCGVSEKDKPLPKSKKKPKKNKG